LNSAKYYYFSIVFFFLKENMYVKNEKDHFYFASAKINSAKSPQEIESAKINSAKYTFLTLTLSQAVNQIPCFRENFLNSLIYRDILKNKSQ